MSRSEHSASVGTRIIERPGQGRVLLVRRSRLTVTAGVDGGQRIELEAAPVTVGGDETCDLLLTDPAVSARHFSLQATPHGILLRDLDSTNGTFVGTHRIGAIYLTEGTTISAGDTQLSIALLGDDLELPLSSRSRLGAMLGHSTPMRAIFALLERVAPSDATLLLEGASGTGKGLAAQAVHELSARRCELFQTIDCGAIPANLIESELFGHRKGAFTGATQDRAGLFEQAHGGTLFLDEIGELPVDLQPKFLRAIEAKEVRRVGETVPRPFDARIIAATNRHLDREVREGRFREDLYFRLSVIRVHMPALRERREEIPRLVAHFLAELGLDPSQGLPETIMTALVSHPWPGNVRELRNVVQRLALVPHMPTGFYLGGTVESAGVAPAQPEGDSGDSDDIPLDQPFHRGKQQCVERFERRYLSARLARCGGNITELVRVTGLSRASCYRLLNRHGLV